MKELIYGLNKKTIGKMLLIRLSFIFCFVNGFTNINCYYLKYTVNTSQSNKTTVREIYISNNFVKILYSKSNFVLFDLKKRIAYDTSLRERKVYKRVFNNEDPFFIKFIVNYGIISNDDRLIFPEVIFRKTGKVERIGNVNCYQVKLPGSFLNSVSYLWFEKKGSVEKGKLYEEYLSCFNKNDNLLQSARNIGGFPIKTLTLFNLNTKKFLKETVLSLDKFIFVDDLFFALPQNCTIIETAD
jgi:hypothetical protein